GSEALEIVQDWVIHLAGVSGSLPNDPLFPATKVEHVGEVGFAATGLDRRGWANAGPIRSIFRAAFGRVGLPNFPPHSLRRTLVQLGEQRCRTPEQFKAWSQNLGHEHVMTTFSSYGAVQSTRQAEIIRSLDASATADHDAATLLEKV